MSLALIAAPATLAQQPGLEEVVVRSQREPSTTFQSLDARAVAAPPQVLSDLIDNLAGVSIVGQGGRLQTYAIRGVGQERVRVQFNGTPLRGLRRAGVSASFLPVQWMKASVEPHSRPVEHGSGSAGGVLSLDRTASRHEAVAQYEHPATVGSLSLLGGDSDVDWIGGLSATGQEDHHAPDGRLLNTAFRSHALLLEHDREGMGTSNRTSLLFSEGRDIGKSASDFPERRTVYPLDRHLYLAHRYTRGAGSTIVWLHAQHLETAVMQTAETSEVDASVVDYGLRYRSPGSRSWSWGVDVFGRHDYEVIKDGVSALDDGKEQELGALVSWGREVGAWEWNLGARWVHAAVDAAGKPAERSSDLLGQALVRWSLVPSLALAAAVSRQVTLPTVSQRFFTGTTGRGSIIGNTDLKPERAWVTEVSATFEPDRWMTSVGIFHMDFDSFIEKAAVDGSVDTFRNAEGGELYGAVAELQYAMSRGTVSAGATWFRGTLDAGTPIRDVPNHRAWMRLTRAAGPGKLRINVAQRFGDGRRSPGERAADPRTLLSVSYDLPLAERWSIRLYGRNLLDELYYETSDAKSPLGAERTLGLRVAVRI